MGPNVWSQGIARKSLMPGSKTMNPTPAAQLLLGKKRVRKASKFFAKVRRRFHRGNPVPAAVLAVGSKLPGLKGLLKTPSEKRAANVAGSLVASAVSGNLTAAKAILERQEFGIQKERAVWRAAGAQIPRKILAAVKTYESIIPGVDHGTPESAAQSALSRAVDLNEIEEAAAEEMRMTKAERTAAARESAARRERTFGTLAGVATEGLKALAGRGRRPRTTRRRRAPRRFSL